MPRERFTSIYSPLIVGAIILLSLPAAALFCSTAQGQCITPPPGMVGWWPGDGNTNDLISGNDGTLVGGATFAAGLVDEAFSFDGSSYVEIPDAPNLNFSSTSLITVDMWVFRTSNAPAMHMIGKRSGCGVMNYQMGLNTGSGEGLFFGNGQSDEVATGQDLPLNVWTQLAATFDGTTYKFYINGALVASAAGTLGDPVPDPLRIGTSGDCEKFGGLIDEVEIFTRTLSDTEIQAIFNAGSSGKCKSGGIPVITSPLSLTVTVGQPIPTYTITATNNPTSFDAMNLPAGLTVNTATGDITGTPTITGTFPVTLSATNGDGTGTASLTLNVNPAIPVITSPLTARGTVEQSFSYQITATNAPTSYSATGLPASLKINSITGLISGTPTVTGKFTVALSATNSAGTGTASLDLTIVQSAPVITSPLFATATMNQFFVYQILADGFPTSFDAANLPPGLSVDGATGFISGFPTKAGTQQVTLTATNSTGSGTAIQTLTVQAPPPSGLGIINGTSVTGRTGSPFTFQVLINGASSAAQLSASNLPPGFEVNSTTGEISGLPASDGIFSVTLTVTEGPITNTSTLELAFTSDLTVPVITSSNRATLIDGQPFSFTIVAPSTSQAVVTFGTIGPLPSGLTVDPLTGVISGIPRNAVQLGISPNLSSGAVNNTEIVACNSSGCAAKDLFFLVPTGAANISTRLSVGTGDNVLIGGFITTGNAPMKLVLRGIGPSLPLDGLLPDPFLELHDGSDMIGSNDNWKIDLAGDSQEVAIENSELSPENPLESAVLEVLYPGFYTAVLKGGHDGIGVGLVEVYNLGAASLDLSSEARLANISTRGFVQTGDDVMIGGFINQGITPIQVVVRAIGPSLIASGVGSALANPTLELHKPDGTVVINDDWTSDQESEILATTLAPTDPRESAILVTLPAGEGAYTAIVRGANNTTGVGLVEAYFGNPCLATSCP